MNNIGKDYDKSNYLFIAYWIPFDGTGMWYFDNDSARNALDFDVGNSSLSHTHNL